MARSPYTQWLANRAHFDVLCLTCVRWYLSDELDLTAFCERDDVPVPRQTLQRCVSNNKRRPIPLPVFQGQPSALSDDEYGEALSSIVVGRVDANNLDAVTECLLDVCRRNDSRAEALARVDARRFARKKLVPEALSILSGHVSPDFSRLLFFQRTNSNNHGLNASRSETTKKNHGGHFSLYDSGVVVHETIIAIGSSGIYLAGNLRDSPHGDESVAMLETTLANAQQSNISVHVIPAGLHRAITQHVTVLRATSPELLHLDVALFPKRLFFDYVVSNVRGANGTRHEALTRSVDIAFSQPQPTAHKRWYHGNRLMPHFKQPGSDFCLNMPADLRNKFLALILHVENVLASRCPDAFQDTLRHEIFSRIWMERTGMERPVRFEYVTVIVKADSGNALNNHMDYMNDGRPGYTHTPVYWYLINDRGVTFRVTMVMTFRTFCGAAMEDIRAG